MLTEYFLFRVLNLSFETLVLWLNLQLKQTVFPFTKLIMIILVATIYALKLIFHDAIELNEIIDNNGTNFFFREFHIYESVSLM